MWAKEWRMLMWPVGVFAMALAWFVVAVLLFNYFLEYQSIALKLAQLNNQRGATELLLVQGNNIILHFMILWSVYFGARSFALERQWGTDILYYGASRAIWQIMLSKIAVLWLSMAMISLPFWLFCVGLITATDWNLGLILGLFFAQLLISLLASLLSLLVSAMVKQAISASLILALLWILLWLAPTLTSEPPSLVAMLKWLSPFEHAALLARGVASVQTIVYVVLHGLIFMTLIPVYWVKDR